MNACALSSSKTARRPPTWDGDGQIHRAGSKTQGSGHGEGDGKPAQAANDIALEG